MKRTDRGTAGFSLLEVVAALAILGLVTVPLCASLLLSVRINGHTRALLEAQLSATAMAEQLLAEGIDLTDGAFAPAGPGRYAMTAEARPAGVAAVTAEVGAGSWFEVLVVGESRGRTVELATAVRVREDGP